MAGAGRRKPSKDGTSRRGLLVGAGAVVAVAAGGVALRLGGGSGPVSGVPTPRIAGPDRLLPFLAPIDSFYRYSNGPPPAPLSTASAALQVGGQDRLRTVAAADLVRMADARRVVTLQCDGNGYEAGGPGYARVGCQAIPDETPDRPEPENWPWRYGGIGTAEWDVLSVANLFSRLGLAAPSGWLRFEGRDGYIRELPAERAADLYIATGMNGQPLPHAHGAPARLLAVGQYGAMNVKWLRSVTCGDLSEARPFDGGPETIYPVKPIAFATQPVEGASITGDVVLYGGAFAGEHPVKEVVLWIDPADAWTAQLIDPGRSGVWSRWQSTVRLPAGRHLIKIACVDASGRQSAWQSAVGDAIGYRGFHELGIDVT